MPEMHDAPSPAFAQICVKPRKSNVSGFGKPLADRYRASRYTLAPLVHPQVVDVVQVDVRQQR
jgi:hypothetical protein